ncbi:MAG TPA: SpoIID/LytB domain-containing protein [Sedimentisphaerales bacterium]|nr:SpoIID/LytB domain-containing protein [Sedimentisphaerales bacterium]
MSTIIQLTADPGKIVSRTVWHVHHLRVSSGKNAILLLLLLILGGCKKRQLTTPTVQMDIESQFWVRVLLFDDVTACTLKTVSPFSVLNEQTAQQTQITETRFNQTNVPISLELTNGRITIDGQALANDNVVIFPDDPYIFNLNGSDYRGKLRLIINPDGNSFDVINMVPPEPYLAGVVGAEMPGYWEPEALKAQAIAARTYCFYIKKRFGTNREWDMKQTAAHQVYRGLSAESAQIWQAVNETKGQVISCKQSDGHEDIFPAYYSSTCGGHTENSKNVFGDSFETLIGVPCPYCQDVAKPKFFFWPMIQFDKAAVTARLLERYSKLKQLGEITNVTVAGQSDYGQYFRLTKVKLIGSTGKSDFLRAEDFRLAIDPTGRKLRSTICQIIKLSDKWAFFSGRGWGHGVGMCQCGAQGMARNGKNTQQILSYYYPGSKIKSIY